ncbi:MAG TPA: type II secretion system protein GspM, partial [Gammaproteobacteria bacterium]|nr:type II secretion system protein GspM [Gammaproteobacteria bacterium]
MVKLRKRERGIVVAGAIVLTLLVVWKPIANRLDAYSKSKGQLAQAENRLRDARIIRAEVESDRRGEEAIKAKIGDRKRRQFNLYSFVNESLRAAKLQDRNQLKTKPNPGSRFDRVQLALNGVSMKELVNFLHLIYASDHLIVLQKLDHLEAARDG